MRALMSSSAGVLARGGFFCIGRFWGDLPSSIVKLAIVVVCVYVWGGGGSQLESRLCLKAAPAPWGSTRRVAVTGQGLHAAPHTPFYADTSHMSIQSWGPRQCLSISAEGT